MKKNVGLLDSYLRLTGGAFLLGYGVLKKSPTVIAFGSCKIAEGVTRWCPMLHVLGISTGSENKDPFPLEHIR